MGTDVLIDMDAGPEARDAPALVRLFTEPEARRYLGGPLSQAAAEERVAGMIGRLNHGARVIREAASGSAIGLVWLSPHHGGPDIELSFVLLPEWQGRGCAFRATSEALRHAFEVLDLPKVVSETQAANVRSLALLERLGMTMERRLPRFGEEQCLYSISKASAKHAP